MKKKKKINIIYIFPAHKSASGGGKVVYKHCELINKFKIDNVSSRILHLKKTKISKILLSLKKRMFNKPSKKYGIIDLKTTNISPSKIENYKLQLESYATIFQNPNSKTPKFSNVEELGLYLFEPKEIINISDKSCNMKFETLYLKGNRCHEELINRITNIIDIYMMKQPPDYNLACASCKFVTSLVKEKYV